MIIIIITIRLSTAANVGKVQEVEHPVPIKFLRGQCVKYNPGSLCPNSWPSCERTV